MNSNIGRGEEGGEIMNERAVSSMCMIKLALSEVEAILGYKTLLKPFIKPLFCTIAVTKRCNLNCKICFFQKQSSSKNEMNLREFENIFSNKLMRSVSVITLTGGEPFLRKDILEILMLADNKLPNLFNLRISSNGTLTKEIISTIEKITSLSSKLITVCISIDGLEATHERVRGKGTYRKTVTTLEELKKIEKRVNNLSIEVKFTVMDENVNEIYELYNKFGSDFEFFYKPCQIFPGHPLYKKGEGSGLAISEETKKTLKEFAETVFLEKEFSGKVSLLDTIRKFFYLYQLEYVENPNIMPLPCTVGFFDLNVAYNGDFHGCEILGMKPFGNVRETPIDEIWYSKAASDFRKWLKKGTCHCYTSCHVYPSLVTRKWKEIAYDYLCSKFRKA